MGKCLSCRNIRSVLKGTTTSTSDVFSSVQGKFSVVCKKAALIDVKSVQNSFLLKRGKIEAEPPFTPQGSASKGGKKNDDDFKNKSLKVRRSTP